ncbi:MAG TPA: hypothetical protein VMG82_36050 [Candidatus Sulfotelmatobacter sp.]|nr:hypothetical protein [Candidatus Sulfotelmatobacter sp.]
MSATQNRENKLVGIFITVLMMLVVTALYAQDKYSLKSPGGTAFSDFKGYEDWSVVSSARTNEVLKVIVANPTRSTRTRQVFRATTRLFRMEP